MRRFLAVAILMALGGWALKRLSDTGNSERCPEGASLPAEEAVERQAQTAADVEASISFEEATDLQLENADAMCGEDAPWSRNEEPSLQGAGSISDNAPAFSDEDSIFPPQTADHALSEGVPWVPDESFFLLESSEQGAPDAVGAQDPLDLGIERKRRRERNETEDEATPPEGLEEEERLRHIQDRLDHLFDYLARDDRAAS